MPLTENDTIRIRQFLQKLESGLIEGMKAYVTYHDSNLASTPSNPTGDGTTGGWHREPTETSNWMSVKTALKDTSGMWGTPIRVFGLQGTETAGVGLSADIPKLEQITFIGDASSKVGWTAGTVTYGDNSYAIAVKAVAVGETDPYIYWDDADGQTSFKPAATFAEAIAAHHWVVCINDSGKAIPATSARILHGGLIQAGTITATEIEALTITAGLIKADAIETAKINNLAVVTAKIADDATTIVESITTTAGINCSHTSHTTIQTKAITSIGGAIHINVSGYFYQWNNPRDMVVALYRGDTLLREYNIGTIGSDYSFSDSLVEGPGSGSQTYYLKAKATGSGLSYDVRAKERLISLVEFKK